MHDGRLDVTAEVRALELRLLCRLVAFSAVGANVLQGLVLGNFFAAEVRLVVFVIRN